MKHYLLEKPIKRGYKEWMRCNESVFASQFEVYTGKVSNLVERNLGERVVRTLCEPIYGNNHNYLWITTLLVITYSNFWKQKIYSLVEK